MTSRVQTDIEGFIGDKSMPELAKLSTDQLAVLMQGLVVLEGSLQALESPIPPCLGGLKSLLAARIRALEERRDSTMTTAEAADYLDLSERYVLKLAKHKEITVAELGKPGRGYTNRYYADSVQEYKNKQSGETLPNPGEDQV